jgi:hypothetical protein
MTAISVGTIGLTPVTNYGVSTKIAHTGFSIESPEPHGSTLTVTLADVDRNSRSDEDMEYVDKGRLASSLYGFYFLF